MAAYPGPKTFRNAREIALAKGTNPAGFGAPIDPCPGGMKGDYYDEASAAEGRSSAPLAPVSSPFKITG